MMKITMGFVIETIILLAGCYSIFSICILRKHDVMYIWGIFVTIVAAFIYDQVTLKVD
ncbi:MAG: hypothetical protein ACOYL3_05105 [Desulfuromonadaceae bacterium]